MQARAVFSKAGTAAGSTIVVTGSFSSLDQESIVIAVSSFPSAEGLTS
jgi:hypothetical protein